jgi:hypothetical protein
MAESHMCRWCRLRRLDAVVPSYILDKRERRQPHHSSIESSSELRRVRITVRITIHNICVESIDPCRPSLTPHHPTSSRIPCP